MLLWHLLQGSHADDSQPRHASNAVRQNHSMAGGLVQGYPPGRVLQA